MGWSGAPRREGGHLPETGETTKQKITEIFGFFTRLAVAIVPAATRQDPRYYTLGHGGFFRRTGYAVSRLLITRTDSGVRTFNFSEIIGNGAGAGVSDLYYPARVRTWTKTGHRLTPHLDPMASRLWGFL